MVTRVSDLQTSAALSGNLARLRARLQEINEQVATGSTLNRASDDPAGAGAVVRSFSVHATLKQDERAAQFARGAPSLPV